MDMIIATARTADKAVTKALIKLKTTNDKLEYEVVDKESIESLSIDAKPAIIRVKKEESIKGKTMDFLPQVSETMSVQVNIIAAYNQGEQELFLDLKGEDMGILIGRRGQTLDSPQYLMSLTVNKGTERYLRVKLDTENYHGRRKETLETLAKDIAYKVRRTKRSVSLEPMNSYKRRITHAALQNDKYVTAGGEGEEPFRHVVVALKKEAASGDCKGRYGRDKGGHYERSDRSGEYRDNRRTNGSNAPQIGSGASAETTAGEEE